MLRLLPLARIGFALVVACLSTARAQTFQQCFTATVPGAQTSWSSSVTVLKFDTSLGTLTQVDFQLTVVAQGLAGVENLGAAPASAHMEFKADGSLQRPDQSVIAFAQPVMTFDDNLGAFDGTIDHAGTSGVTHLNISVSASGTGTSQPSDLALFSGPAGNPGTLVLPVVMVGSSTVSGAPALNAAILQTASANVLVCYTFLPNTPPSFTPGSPCGGFLMTSVGLPLVFDICAEDGDPLDVVSLTSGSLPAGATTVPALPAIGNPVCVTVSWTPTEAQLGTADFHFLATDTHLSSAVCTIHTLIPECYQVLGRGSGGSVLMLGGTTFQSHLGSVRLVHPVTMAQHPGLKIPSLAAGELQFSMQTLMYNPLMFPANPHQWSQRLRVTVLPGQMVLADLHESLNGIHQGIATFTDAVGDPYVTFPFAIDGM